MVAVAKWVGHHDVGPGKTGHRREAEEDGHWQAMDDKRPDMLPHGLGVRAKYRPTRVIPVSPGRVDSLM
ncbi:hypothetical protein GCM10018791_31250 [Streptomyces zaomyceticus]|nr:hypothetical protein GCM10018791_31250 [Streptomyces zaomyceticus]